MRLPDWFRALVWRIRALRDREALERGLSEEMRLHIDLEAADLARTRGLDPLEARRQALLRFGGVERFKEAHRDARGTRWLEDLAQDVKYAARSLRRNPGFTLTATAVLALGIGSGTAIFSAVDAVLIARLPYPDDGRLVRIYQQNSPGNRFGLSTVDFRAIAAEQRTLSSLGGLRWRSAAVAGGGDPRGYTVGAITAGFLPTLGVQVLQGRPILTSDEPESAARVALVTRDFAARELGGEVDALHRFITIDGVAHAVVGVLPDQRDLTGFRAPVFVPLSMPTPTRRGPFGMRIIGRLKDGVSIDAARADMAGISERLFPLWQSSFQDRSVRFVPYGLRETILARAGETLGLLVVAVALVLLIAVANVASLALVRATARARETSLRTALGASRSRVARLLITEGVLVAGAGAAAGLLLAFTLVRGAAVFGLAVPRLAEASVDARAFGFAALLAMVVGVVVAIHPVLSLWRTGARAALQGGGRDVGARQSTQVARGVLVAAQFGLALPVLAAAALLLNSFVRLERVDPGFDPSRLLYVGISLPRAAYGDSGATARFWTRALNRVGEIPAVETAGLNQSLPPEEPPDVNNFVLVDGAVDPGAAQPVSPWSVVSASFFETASVPLLEGRMFSAGDTGVAPVLIVSRTWARMYSPGRSAIGRQVQGGGCTTCVPYTVIGVVEDVKYLGLAGSAEAVYEPVTQQPSGDLFLMVRTAGPPGQSLEAVREAIRSIDPRLALDDAGTMSQRLASSVAPERHRTALIAGFGAAALLLAAVGIFGMLSYLVTTRRREIGVRMALGARRGEVQQFIIRRGMRWAASGAALGVVAALLTGKWLAASLYEVTPSDPATLAGVTLLLLLVAVVASWLPARRAASVAPMEAIREE